MRLALLSSLLGFAWWRASFPSSRTLSARLFCSREQTAGHSIHRVSSFFAGARAQHIREYFMRPEAFRTGAVASCSLYLVVRSCRQIAVRVSRQQRRLRASMLWASLSALARWTCRAGSRFEL